MDFVAVLDQVIALLRQRGRVAYRTLKRQFQLDDEALEDLKVELIKSQRLAADEDGEVLVWMGGAGTGASAPSAPVENPGQAPLAYTPSYLAEKIRSCTRALRIIPLPLKPATMPHLTILKRGQGHGFTPFLLPTRSVGPRVALRHAACC
jgi:hypothetical protein